MRYSDDRAYVNTSRVSPGLLENSPSNAALEVQDKPVVLFMTFGADKASFVTSAEMRI